MPDISRLVIEVDSKGVVTATGNLSAFEAMSKKVGKSTGDLANKMGALQLIAGQLPGPLKSIASGLMGIVSPATAAVSAFIEFVKIGKQSIDIYREQEVHLVRLGAVIDATNAKTWTSSIEMGAMADSIRRSTGRSSNEIMQMQSVLLGFTGITGENFERLTRNMVNMADVMGGSLVSSANTFGRALENPSASLNALTRQGFVFTEEQKRMVRALEDAGRIQDAQVIYLEAMENAFGNAAEAVRDARGATVDWKLAIEDLQREFGRIMDNPFINFIIGGAAKGISWFANDIWGGVNEIREANKELNDVLKAYGSGEYTNEQAITAIQHYIKILQEMYVREAELIRKGKENKHELADIYNGIHIWLEKLDNYELKRDDDNRVSASKKEFERQIGDMLTEYEKTDEYRAERIEREIAKWMRLRESIWEVDSGVFEGLSDEHKRQIDAIISNLNRGKEELNSWQKIFRSSMRLSDNDTKQDWFKTQTTSINQFVRVLNTANDRAKILNDTIGIDFVGSLEDAVNKWESLASEMIMSGEWAADTELFLRVVEYAREARDALNEANLDNFIAGLNDEYRLLRMNSREMDRHLMLSEYRVTNEEKIIEALEAQKKLRNEQDKNSAISRITGLSVEDIQGSSMDYIFSQIERQNNNNVRELEFARELGIISADEYVSGLEKIADELVSINLAFRETANVAAVTSGERRFITVEDEYGMAHQIPDPADSFQNFINELSRLMEAARAAAMNARGQAYLTDLMEQLEHAGKSTHELAVRRLEIEKDISREHAEQALEVQKQIDYIINGYDLMGEIMTSIDDALRSIRSGEGGYGQYFGAAMAQSALESVQGTDVGNFAQGAAMGGPIVGLINMLVGSLTNVLMSIEGIDDILSPLTMMLMELKDVFKALLLPVLITARLLVELAKGINWLLNILSFGLIDQLARTYDTLTATNDERQREEERLRALNDQYRRLYDALKDQEEYYLQQRRNLNAEWAIENFQNARQVNDMILSPHGAFSTHPRDYIIATKHPEALMGGGAAVVNISIINNTNANVSKHENTGADGVRNIKIIVGGIVQQGIINGEYDGAFDVMNNRRQGKRLHS